MTKVEITRQVSIPDEIKIARFKKTPELGPKILFFSGGTALREISKEIIKYSHNTIHIITAFDSGGSSRKIRDAFDMIAVGDLRNRMMALADQSIKGNPEIYKLFAHRLPLDKAKEELLAILLNIINGSHPMISIISNPMRKIITNHLQFFVDIMPNNFDLKGASIGNLIIVGGYFSQDKDIDSVIFMFSKLVESRGVVRPVTSESMHIGVELSDGVKLVGQDLITGKEQKPLNKKIKNIFLTRNHESNESADIETEEKIVTLINSADLICYPMGSFYSSLLVNLLPKGVGSAIAKANCPKVYLMNSYEDPERFGLNPDESVKVLLEYLKKDCSDNVSTSNLLNFVVTDLANSPIRSTIDVNKIEDLGVKFISTPLMPAKDEKIYSPTMICDFLASLS
ncbi:MAG: GAK system CofD-like protein [Pseudomonadota bacterium]